MSRRLRAGASRAETSGMRATSLCSSCNLHAGGGVLEDEFWSSTTDAKRVDDKKDLTRRGLEPLYLTRVWRAVLIHQLRAEWSCRLPSVGPRGVAAVTLSESNLGKYDET